MTCDAISGTEKKMNHPCVLDAKWSAEVRHTLGVWCFAWASRIAAKASSRSREVRQLELAI